MPRAVESKLACRALAMIARTPQESQSAMRSRRILAFATQGAGGNDEARVRELFSRLPTDIFPFDRNNRTSSALAILRAARRGEYGLFVMEGSGSAGGIALILARRLFGSSYLVSSGDAIAPFLTARWPMAKCLFELYERTLYRNASGFIGWTPYLVGRALTMGAPRGMTAAGWNSTATRPHILRKPAHECARNSGSRLMRSSSALPDPWSGASDIGIVTGMSWWRPPWQRIAGVSTC